MEKIVLYIHGMGGGGDSRIPLILRDIFARPVMVLPSTEGPAHGYNPLRGSTLASPSVEGKSKSEAMIHSESIEGNSAEKTAVVRVVAQM